MQSDRKLRSQASAKAVEIRSLRKSFRRREGGGVVVPVDDITIDVVPNEMLVLLGPSGCGKTTLLRCIAGLERPDSGEILIEGQTVFSSARNLFLPPNRRPISMVFQSYALWPHMTVFENVAFPLYSRGMTGRSVTQRVNEVLELVGLGNLGKQYTNQISGGQQQRVALARSVAAQTGVILFDEPLSNIDAKVREQLRSEIVRMQRTLGFSGVYVTHDQVEAMTIGHRIAVLNEGRIEQVGPPEEVYAQPVNKYVATFIGVANILTGTVLDVRDRAVTIKTAIGEHEAIASATKIAYWKGLPARGDQVQVLARPEALDIRATDPGNSHVKCTVVSRSFLGAYTEYVVAAPGDIQLRAWSSGIGRIREGEEAWLSAVPSALVLLGDRPN